MTQPTFTNLTNGSSTTHPFVTGSVTPTANRLILVTVNAYIATGGINPSAPTVVGNGITYESIREQIVDPSGTTDRATMWVFRGMSASPSAGTITITFSGVIPTRAAWIVDQSDSNVDTSGTNGSGAIVAGTLNGSTSASSVTTQPTSFNGSMTSGNGAFFACGKENTDTQTPRTNWTELADVVGTSLVGTESQYLSGAATDTGGSSTWTNAIRAGSILIEIAAAGGGSPDATVSPDAIVAQSNVPQATVVVPQDYSTLLFFSDPQCDGGSGTNTRVSDNLNLVRATSHDLVQGGGDYCNNWLAAEQTDFDARFNTGGLKAETHVVMGNHEYDYNWHNGWDYFGSPLAGSAYTAPWHSYDMPNGWHIICLDYGNSLASGSTQYNWLSTDLDDHSDIPTLVFLHWGRYSGCSAHGNNTGASDAFALLLTHPWVEAMLSGHQHQYERFARMNNAGAVDSTNGIRQFTAPPSGQITTLTNSSPTGLEFYADSQYSGVMRLKLYSNRYEWDVLTPAGYNAITDSGSQTTRYTISTADTFTDGSNVAQATVAAATDATVTAATVAASTGIPTPARVSNATVTGSSTSAVTGIPTPVRVSNATITATAVASVTAISTPTHDSELTAAAVAAATLVPTATVTTQALMSVTPFEVASWTTTTTPKTITVTGALTGDLIIVQYGGDNGTGGSNVSNATVTTTGGSTSVWSEIDEALATTNQAWLSAATATVTGDGTVTVSLARTQSGGRLWGGFALLIHNHNGVGNHSHSAPSSAETTSLATSQDSAVSMLAIDWDALALVAFSPAGSNEIERSRLGAGPDLSFYAAYWLSQATGTRGYGIGTSSTTNLHIEAIEILAPAGGTDATVTAGTVIAVTAIPTPTRVSDATVAANAVPALASLPSATVIANVSQTVSATAVTATTAIPTPTRTSDATITATVVAASTGIPTPTRTSAASVTATAVATTTVVPTPTVLANTNATVSAVSVGAVGGVPTPTVVASTNATITGTAVTASAAIPTPDRTSLATVAATAVQAILALPTPSVTGATSATISAVTISAVTGVPLPSLNRTVTVAAVTAATAIPTPVRTSPATITATAVVVRATVPGPTVSAAISVTITAVTVSGSSALPTATIMAGAGATILAATVAARAAVPVPIVAGLVNGSSVPGVAGFGNFGLVTGRDNAAVVAHGNTSTASVSDTGVTP